MAFLHSGPARQPVFQAPAVVLWLIALLVAAHGGRLLLGEDASNALILRYAFIPVRYTLAGSLWDKAVPFVSYMALHGSWTHLAMNCVWLLAFGPIVARRFGAPLFLLFFLITGILGAAAFLACDWGGAEPVIGASGAISGLMGAGIRLLPRSFSWALPGESRMAPLLSRQVLSFSAVWTVINVLVGTLAPGMVGAGGAIAWQAHLGGYFAGLLLAGLFDRLRPLALAPPLSES